MSERASERVPPPFPFWLDWEAMNMNCVATGAARLKMWILKPQRTQGTTAVNAETTRWWKICATWLERRLFMNALPVFLLCLLLPALLTWSSETFGQPASQRCNKLKTITTKPSPKRIILLDVGVERLRRLRNGEDLRIEWLSGEGENVLSGWNFSLNQHEINSSTVNIHSPFKESLYPLIPFNCRLN